MKELQFSSYLPIDCQMGEIINPVSNQKIGTTNLTKKMEGKITQNDKQAIYKLDVNSKESIEPAIVASDKLPNFKKGGIIFTPSIMTYADIFSLSKSAMDRKEIGSSEALICNQRKSIAINDMMSASIANGCFRVIRRIKHKNGKVIAQYRKCREKFEIFLKNPRFLCQKIDFRPKHNDYFIVYLEEV
jgi:hypothetical protein